ncbi:MAG: M48 family metallopeptidase [Cytophagales bacterium]|nr:M48 family metallopeptidase [Cytophagales bacterium]
MPVAARSAGGVHLKHPNHSTEFWNELDKKMPDFREHENWLKRNGVKMSL